MTRPLPAGRAPPRRARRARSRDLARGRRRGSSAGDARLADVLLGGGRLLAAGNGGCAAQAQHLTAELVGRYRDDRAAVQRDRRSAPRPSALTAIGNDYGIEEVFARQVRAHGRPGDVLLALSTSGRSPERARRGRRGARSAGWSTLGADRAAGQPARRACDDCLCVDAPHTATVQEIHLIAIHLLCAAVDEALRRRRGARRAVRA